MEIWNKLFSDLFSDVVGIASFSVIQRDCGYVTHCDRHTWYVFL